MFNHDRRAWGPLELRMSARFWSPKEAIPFSEFLESVEAKLPLPALASAEKTASREKISAAERR
jgi:hypothetical protein